MKTSSRSGIDSLRREKRTPGAGKRRKANTRSRIVRFLIVCEGTQTEPNYFRALVRDRYSEVRAEEIRGEGKSTSVLVERAKQIRDTLERVRQLAFDRVWVVFDKDDFTDFNAAIRLAKSYSFHCAWSNEAFELWYLLHFRLLSTPVRRQDYITKLSREIGRRLGDTAYEYRKNNAGIYEVLTTLGDEDFAKANARKLREYFRGDTNYEKHNPCTTVDLLVEELEHPDKLGL